MVGTGSLFLVYDVMFLCGVLEMNKIGIEVGEGGEGAQMKEKLSVAFLYHCNTCPQSVHGNPHVYSPILFILRPYVNCEMFMQCMAIPYIN